MGIAARRGLFAALNTPAFLFFAGGMGIAARRGLFAALNTPAFLRGTPSAPSLSTHAVVQNRGVAGCPRTRGARRIFPHVETCRDTSLHVGK